MPIIAVEENLPAIPLDFRLHFIVTVEFLGAFCADDISKLAGRERHLRLSVVEGVILGVESVSKGFDIAARVEFGPWLGALETLAGFENHHERIQSRNDRRQGTAGKLVG